jgi:hypothetical protein
VEINLDLVRNGLSKEIEMKTRQTLLSLVTLTLALSAQAAPQAKVFAMGKVTSLADGELVDYAKAAVTFLDRTNSVQPSLNVSLSGSSQRFENKESIEVTDVVDSLQAGAKLGQVDLQAGYGNVAYGFDSNEMVSLTAPSLLGKLSGKRFGDVAHATIGTEYRGLSLRTSAFEQGMTVQAIQKLRRLQVMGSLAREGATLGLAHTLQLTNSLAVKGTAQVARNAETQAFHLGSSLSFISSEIGLRFSQSNEDKNEVGLAYRQKFGAGNGKVDVVSEAFRVDHGQATEYKSSLAVMLFM